MIDKYDLRQDIYTYPYQLYNNMSLYYYYTNYYHIALEFYILSTPTSILNYRISYSTTIYATTKIVFNTRLST